MARITLRREQNDALTFKLLSASSAMRRLTKIPTAVDRIVAALATGKLARLHIIAQRLLRDGATVAKVAKMVEAASRGFVPKGEFSRKEFQKAFVLFKLGGARACQVNKMTDGGPSKRAVQTQDIFKVVRHLTCSGVLTILTMRENLQQWAASAPKPKKPSLWHMLFDNINAEERLRYSTAAVGGGLRGAARESTFQGDMRIRSYTDVKRIEQALQDGEIILAKEVTLVVLARNSKLTAIIPLFSSGTPKLKGYKKGAEDQGFIVTKGLEIWSAEFASTFGPIA